MINNLPRELQNLIASYLNTSHLCFFAQASKSNLQVTLPLLKVRQQALLQSKWRMAGWQYTSMGYTSQALYACGNNSNGQLGLGDSTNRTTFTRIEGLEGKIQQVVVGDAHTLVLTSQGLYACGNNGNGQLGLGDNIVSCNTFTRVEQLPYELKQQLARYQQVATLITLGEAHASDVHRSLTLEQTLEDRIPIYRS